jgi:DNA invertase Pin-like site-specific DNA recombinase
MQECSIQNQAVAIQRYAEANGFKVVTTYEDAGKSGLTITQRKGLQSLLSDVLQHKAMFSAVLVYDVSRWGRFQDSDEAAHYEFLCKSSGVKVYYCAEEFGPEETLPARMMKALKRTMAAEFSRELSQRVSIGKRNRAQMGFRQGGQPGYSLRRMLVGPNGVIKQALRNGELKSISSEHVILVPGPERERKWVRWIYAQRIRGLQICEIVKELNLRRIPWIDGKPWNRYGVRQILTNPKYAGWNCWGKRSERLKTKSRPNPREQWVTVEGAFKGIVDQATFDRAQQVIQQRLNYKSNETVLGELKALWRRYGTLSESMIDKARGVPAVSSLRRRFGSMVKLYDLLGFKPAPIYTVRAAKAKRLWRLRAQVFASIRERFPYEVTFTQLSRRHLYCFAFPDVGKVGVVLCRSFKKPEGLRYWIMYTQAVPRDLPVLVCLLSSDNESIEAHYVMPKIDAVTKMTLTPRDPWFQGGIRLESFTELHSALREVKTWVPLRIVYRGFSNLYTQLMGRPSRNHIHDEERREAALRTTGVGANRSGTSTNVGYQSTVISGKRPQLSK